VVQRKGAPYGQVGWPLVNGAVNVPEANESSSCSCGSTNTFFWLMAITVVL
jgi:hypothetical protein